MQLSKSLDPLIQALSDHFHLRSAIALLQWDQEIYMPQGSLKSRVNQLASLSAQLHRLGCSSAFESILATYVDLNTGSTIQENLNQADQRLLNLTYKQWLKNRALPEDFVKDFAALKSESQHYWQKARHENKRQLFLPYLSRMVDAQARYASYIDATKPVYDVLLDDYEEGMTESQLISLFDPLKESLSLILKNRSHDDEKSYLDHCEFDIKKQKQLNHFLLDEVGFSSKYGRMDVSAHPFTTSFHPQDVRITTRYAKNDLSEALSSTLHEAGHGMYEQGLPLKWAGLPVGDAVSLGIHESQSRLWENMIMKSMPFWQSYYPYLQDLFKSQLKRVSLDQFYAHISRVKPGFIRVEADEVSYNLHIFIRFDLERRLVSGDLSVKDLPNAWNDAYHRFLGLDIQSDSQGFLQDVHWSCGLFAYFPTYTLGNIYAAQLFECLKKDVIKNHGYHKALFAEIKTWLDSHIYQFASLHKAADLMKKITGKNLNSDIFLRYINEKYARP